MSKIIKGLPASFLVTIKDNGRQINLNDSTWTSNASLKFQTIDGSEPFSVNCSASGNGMLVSLTGSQTAQLNSAGTGYVLIVRSSKNDETINLRSVINLVVLDDV